MCASAVRGLCHANVGRLCPWMCIAAVVVVMLVDRIERFIAIMRVYERMRASESVSA